MKIVLRFATTVETSVEVEVEDCTPGEVWRAAAEAVETLPVEMEVNGLTLITGDWGDYRVGRL